MGLLTAAIPAVAGGNGAQPEGYITTVVPPTCTGEGYTLLESGADGSLSIRDEVPALGHEPGEWSLDPGTGRMTAVCARCGERLEKSAYEGAIPRIDLSGSLEGIGKSERVVLNFQYAGADDAFACYAYTSLQGHASLAFPKKNYTVRLYDDAEITQKHKLSFRHWQREHKYVLKANYRDVLQVRNLVAADIWADMAKTRPNLCPTLRGTSHLGAVDGFPVAVYLNGDFLGLYTLNLHIDDDLYAMKNVRDAVVIANDSAPEETRFYAPAAFVDEKTAWEVEYCGTGEDDEWVRDRLNALIAFVSDSDEADFRAHLSEYLDVNGAIDYLIFIYALGLPDNAAQDLVLLSYDGGVWIPTVYDMEHAFGLTKDGSGSLSPEAFLPDLRAGRQTSGTESLLWDRLLASFGPQLADRYRQLRQTVLSQETLTARVRAAAEAIPGEYREMDLQRYPRDDMIGDPLAQMTEYIAGRLPALDMALLGEVMTSVPGDGQGEEDGGVDG